MTQNFGKPVADLGGCFTAISIGLNELSKQFAQAGSLLEGMGLPDAPTPVAEPQGITQVPVSDVEAQRMKTRRPVLAALVEDDKVAGKYVARDAVNWDYVKAVGVQAGRTPQAVAGMLDGEHVGYLTWVEKGKSVRINDRGLDELERIDQLLALVSSAN